MQKLHLRVSHLTTGRADVFLLKNCTYRKKHSIQISALVEGDFTWRNLVEHVPVPYMKISDAEMIGLTLGNLSIYLLEWTYFCRILYVYEGVTLWWQNVVKEAYLLRFLRLRKEICSIPFSAR